MDKNLLVRKRVRCLNISRVLASRQARIMAWALAFVAAMNKPQNAAFPARRRLPGLPGRDHSVPESVPCATHTWRESAGRLLGARFILIGLSCCSLSRLYFILHVCLLVTLSKSGCLSPEGRLPGRTQPVAAALGELSSHLGATFHT